MCLCFETVEDDDLVAPLEQPRNEVRADEAGATGNKSSHGLDIAWPRVPR
jgi:hypothetical protein